MSNDKPPTDLYMRIIIRLIRIATRLAAFALGVMVTIAVIIWLFGGLE